MINNLASQEKFDMAFMLLIIDFTLVISVLSLLSGNHLGEKSQYYATTKKLLDNHFSGGL
jgi:hypothetical protein